MPKSTLATLPLGPFDGAVDQKGASVPATGKLRMVKNMVFSGVNRFQPRLGNAVALTLKDDAGTPATVTSVLAVQQFMDFVVLVAHSTVTSKCYLYRTPTTMDSWYDATGALQSNATPQPIAVLWSSMTVAPDVTLAEGLGTLWVANTSAIDVNGLYFPTKQVTFSVAGVPTLTSLVANGTNKAAGVDVAYFTTVVSFHQHLWGVGYGAGAVAGYTSYRPELAKFSQPSFDPLQTSDSIVVGDRVRALKERTIGAVVAGNALFLWASKSLFRITGYGRDSWFVETLDQRYGGVGPKSGVAVGNTLYLWSSRGLMRCDDAGQVEPLWDATVATIATVSNESRVVLGFDQSTDQVMALYDQGSGTRALMAFDTRRNCYASFDGDIGVAMRCAGIVDVITSSTATPPAAPAVPTLVSSTVQSSSSAIATWTVGDALAQHEVTFRQQGLPTYSLVATTDPGVTSTTFTGLNASTAYEWRLRAVKNGIYSAYVGPAAASQFTTSATASSSTPAAAPTGLTATQVGVNQRVGLAWTNAVPTLPTQISRSTDGVTFAVVGTAAALATSYTDTTGANGLFYYVVRHVAGDGTLGTLSNVASVSVSGPL